MSVVASLDDGVQPGDKSLLDFDIYDVGDDNDSDGNQGDDDDDGDVSEDDYDQIGGCFCK
jgi:hypothetical protein